MKANPSGSPLADIRALMEKFDGPDEACIAKVRDRDGQLTKPPGSLGRLEDIAEWLAAWQRSYPPVAERPMAAIFAGNHGVTAQGISAFPKEVTAQMVANFTNGGAAINQICKTYGAGLRVFELALEEPTGDISKEAAMTEKDCAAAIAYGMQAVDERPDVLCIGEMGIGNTTIAAALCLALFGGTAEDWVGPGTGLDDKGIAHKAEIVTCAVTLHNEPGIDALEILRRLGGREVAAMVGAIIAARLENVPVLIDGYIATSAAAIVKAMRGDGLDHCLAAHCSAEPAHKTALGKINKEPILNLGMRLGEGSGAGLVIGIVQAAANLHNGMATFQEAGVAGKS